MSTVPSPLPAILAGLRAALEADARTAPALQTMLLSLLLRLVAQLESLVRAWNDTQPSHAPLGRQGEADPHRLPFHLRLRDARRARILSRGSRGRLRIGIWWWRNRGARAIPGRVHLPTRPIAARAPPHPRPA